MNEEQTTETTPTETSTQPEENLGTEPTTTEEPTSTETTAETTTEPTEPSSTLIDEEQWSQLVELIEKSNEISTANNILIGEVANQVFTYATVYVPLIIVVILLWGFFKSFLD